MTQLHRPRPERADSPELAAFRQLKAAQPELAGAVDMQVELVVMRHRVQARLSTPWLEFDIVWLARQLADGRPILRFREIPFEWGEFRTLFRQVFEVLRRYDLVERTDASHVQQLIRAGRPTCDDVEAWYDETASRGGGQPSAEPSQPEAVGQVLALAARPFLARTVETLHQRVDLSPWSRPYCPFCGGDAELALLLRPGERRLACGRCTGVWPFPEHACPHCDNRLPGHQTSYTSRDGRYRVVGCDACRRYIKAFDARRADRPFMLDVDTIATLPLDAAALQRGYLA
ncbi:MAG: formate dehydrogenase accessory protein FdhE [Vicinamibacterales bacterium]